MKTVGHAALGGLILLSMAACGSGQPTSSPTTGGSIVTTPAAQSGGPSASVAKARATISVDALLFVGANTAKVGDTFQVTVTNEESSPVRVRLLNPSGTAVSQIEVSAGSTGQVEATLDTAGKWTVAFKDQVATDELTRTITVH